MIKNSDYISFETNDLSSEDIYVFQYVLNKNLSNFTKYLENNNNRYTSDFMTIIIYNQSNSMILDIGDAQNFKKEFNKYKNNLKNDFEYNQMLKSITEIEETNVN